MTSTITTSSRLVTELQQLESATPIELKISAQRTVLLCRVLQGELALIEIDDYLEPSWKVVFDLYNEIYTYLCSKAPHIAAWLKELEDSPNKGCIGDGDELWWLAYPEECLPP